MQKQTIGQKIVAPKSKISATLLTILLTGLILTVTLLFAQSTILAHFRGGNLSITGVDTPKLAGNYVGTVAIDKPLALGILDISLAITDTNGVLSGFLDNRGSLAYPQSADLQGSITGQIDGITTTFHIATIPFTSKVSGREVTRSIQFGGTIEDDATVIRGVYTETISGFTPQPLLVNGMFLASRAAPAPDVPVTTQTPSPTPTATSTLPTTRSPVNSEANAAVILLHSQAAILLPKSSTVLSVQVRDANGHPFAGVPVRFSADSGAVSPATVVSDVGGVAATTYTADTGLGQVVVAAEVNGAIETAYLEIRSSVLSEPATNTVVVDANVDKQKPGDQTAITVIVLDPSGAPVIGETVTIFSSFGEVNPASATTNLDGKVTSTFTAGNYNGRARIVALSGNGSGATDIQVIGPVFTTPTPIATGCGVFISPLAC